MEKIILVVSGREAAGYFPLGGGGRGDGANAVVTVETEMVMLRGVGVETEMVMMPGIRWKRRW